MGNIDVQIVLPAVTQVETLYMPQQAGLSRPWSSDLPALLLKAVCVLGKLGLLLGNICPLSLQLLPRSCHTFRLGLNLSTTKRQSECCSCFPHLATKSGSSRSMLLSAQLCCNLAQYYIATSKCHQAQRVTLLVSQTRRKALFLQSCVSLACYRHND